MPVTITQVPDTPAPARAANSYGVGETITFTAADTGGGTAIWKWSLSGPLGRGHFSSNGNRARLILFGFDDNDLTLTAKNTYNGAEASVTLHVFAPAGWSLGPHFNDYHVPGQAHAQFQAAAQFSNIHNVSFNNMEMREGNAMPERTGRYVSDNINVGNHHQQTFPLSAAWVCVRNSLANAALQLRASPNHIALAIDNVSSHGFSAPFTADGTFTWRIPWSYRITIPVAALIDVNGTAVSGIDMGLFKIGATIPHQEVLTGNRMTMSKGGQTLSYRSTDP